MVVVVVDVVVVVVAVVAGKSRISTKLTIVFCFHSNFCPSRAFNSMEVSAISMYESVLVIAIVPYPTLNATVSK